MKLYMTGTVQCEARPAEQGARKELDMKVSTQEIANHAAVLGRHGAKKRWKATTKDERARVMELVRRGKAKRAREGKRPQNPVFAWMNARLQRDNELSRGRRN